MKTTSLPNASPFLTTIFLSVGLIVQAQLPFRPLYDAPANPEEQQELNSLLVQARAASASVQPGSNAGFQRRQIAIELNNELESFVAGHTNSAWTAGVRLWLARNAQLRSSYLQAMAHYGRVWATVRGLTNLVAGQMAHQAGGGLALSKQSASNPAKNRRAANGAGRWKFELGRANIRRRRTSVGCILWINSGA